MINMQKNISVFMCITKKTPALPQQEISAVGEQEEDTVYLWMQMII